MHGDDSPDPEKLRHTHRAEPESLGGVRGVANMNRYRVPIGNVLFVFALGISMSVPTQAQSVAPLHAGDLLPDVFGQSLSGTPSHLSTASAGKVAVVVFSFSKAGGKDTQLWNRNLVRDFGSDRSVALSTVIMLEAAPRLLRGIIVSRLKNDMPPPLRGSTIVSYENEKLWKQRLRVADDSHAYVVLFGPDGRIRWMNSRALGDTEYKELKTKIHEQFKSGPNCSVLNNQTSSVLATLRPESYDPNRTYVR